MRHALATDRRSACGGVTQVLYGSRRRRHPGHLKRDASSDALLLLRYLRANGACDATPRAVAGASALTDISAVQLAGLAAWWTWWDSSEREGGVLQCQASLYGAGGEDAQTFLTGTYQYGYYNTSPRYPDAIARADVRGRPPQKQFGVKTAQGVGRDRSHDLDGGSENRRSALLAVKPRMRILASFGSPSARFSRTHGRRRRVLHDGTTTRRLGPGFHDLFAKPLADARALNSNAESLPIRRAASRPRGDATGRSPQPGKVVSEVVHRSSPCRI